MRILITEHQLEKSINSFIIGDIKLQTLKRKQCLKNVYYWMNSSGIVKIIFNTKNSDKVHKLRFFDFPIKGLNIMFGITVDDITPLLKKFAEENLNLSLPIDEIYITEEPFSYVYNFKTKKLDHR